MDIASKNSLVFEEEYHLLSEERVNYQARKERRKFEIVTTILAVLLLLVPPSAYWLGLQKGRAVLPQLRTDVITSDAVKYESTYLDDEFEIQLEENKKFKGPPRPELDEAWEGLTAGINVRVPQDRAEAAGFQSIELSDGSGDVWASPAVLHNLHCLRTIRQAQFPDYYPEIWEIMKPNEDGSPASHMDHCLDNLRQAIMCQGDMALYHYGWRENTKTPGLSMRRPHVCVNWQQLQGWAIENSFSVFDDLLYHPQLGKADASTWHEHVG